MKRKMLIVVFAVGLLVGSWLALPQPEAAARPCQFPYTIRPGDTLSGIAASAGINIWRLAHLNGLWNIHRIYAGQVLCLPVPLRQSQPGEQPPPAGSTKSSLDLVAEYTFDPDADPDAQHWTLGRDGTGGLRRRYPLASGDPIEIFADPTEVRQASLSRSPLLWLVRTSTEAVDYTLVAIGDPKPLLDLQMEITHTQTITDIIPPPDPALIELGLCPETKQPVDKLSLSGKNQVRLYAELMGADGTFVPVTISQIDYHDTAELAGSCYVETGFALHPTENPQVEGYRLLMVLNEDGKGPPTGGPRRCQNWGGSGWWSRWRWTFFRC